MAAQAMMRTAGGRGILDEVAIQELQVRLRDLERHDSEAAGAGPITEGERLMRPVKAFGTPAADLMMPKPFVKHRSMLDVASPAGSTTGSPSICRG
jgi:hypothetical protein